MVHSGTGPENIATRSSGTVTDLFNQFMKEKDAFDRSNYRAKFISGSYNGEVIGHYFTIVGSTYEFIKKFNYGEKKISLMKLEFRKNTIC